MLVLDSKLVKHLSDLFPGHNRIIDEEHAGILAGLRRSDVDDERFAKGIGEYLFDVEQGYQGAVLEQPSAPDTWQWYCVTHNAIAPAWP